jgi:hypothetical protein
LTESETELKKQASAKSTANEEESKDENVEDSHFPTPDKSQWVDEIE